MKSNLEPVFVFKVSQWIRDRALILCIYNLAFSCSASFNLKFLNSTLLEVAVVTIEEDIIIKMNFKQKVSWVVSKCPKVLR